MQYADIICACVLGNRTLICKQRYLYSNSFLSLSQEKEKGISVFNGLNVFIKI